jgi:hypothetical protein
VTVEFNERGEPEVKGYCKSRGKRFTPTEVKEAYVSASTSAGHIKEDRAASALFSEFRQGRKTSTSNGTTCEVFTWSNSEQPEISKNRKKVYKGMADGSDNETTHVLDQDRCVCCQSIDFVTDEIIENGIADVVETVLIGKKYKPVGLKVRPVYTELPEKYRIKREIKGDPLGNMPGLDPNPVDFCPTGRYTQERKEIIDKLHPGNFLWGEERKLLHHFMMIQEDGFAWNDEERGSFRHDFFPPVEIPVIEHEPWVEKSIPIPRGQLEEFCKIIKRKIDAGVYEPSNSSYRGKFFGVIKKDGKSIRLVHALEPLNAVTIAHSGVPPATEELANHFAGRACGGCLDLYSGYDQRDIAEGSRDFTTFQTPFGALRLVKLPQGWTNSVPIFHDDVTYILRDEIPHVTIPYIDDVPVRGPGSRYQSKDGKFETIPENLGIRRFVWEHFQNINRIVQRIKYCGGTFSGAKSVVCADEFHVVGHVCCYEGRKPDTDRVGVILRWGPLKDVSGVRQFLGTVGVMRMFIEKYGEIARPIQKLTQKDMPFEWGKLQEAAMEALKKAIANAPWLRPLNYEWETDIVLAVDTSWIAVGVIVYQIDLIDNKKKHYAKFASLPLNTREARFSQPKRELYGIKRALTAMQYWLLGCRRLVVETDALYIKGMLSNPGMGPNATINRWIEQILMFQFKLKHVKGATFAPDGLSRRESQPGDEEWLPDEDGLDETVPPEDHPDWDYSGEQPEDFDNFKDTIDMRGGYTQSIGQGPSLMEDFMNELRMARSEEEAMSKHIRDAYKSEGLEIPQYLQGFEEPEEGMLPDEGLRYDPEKREPYPEDHRSETAKDQDKRLELVREWLKDTMVRPPGMEKDLRYKRFMKHARKFFYSSEGKLYRRGENSMHRLVVDKDHRMYMMRAAHDSLGHRGGYATSALIGLRFWWPEFEKDVRWYVKTCEVCQKRELAYIRIPPVVTATPSIFQRIHADVMHMSEMSNKCGYIVNARCALSRYIEARGLSSATAEAVGKFLLEEIICRWGCPKWIVTDNGSIFVSAVKWLNAKYGIVGIRISSYNSQANGTIERGHWDIRQSLFKATNGDLKKWFWFLALVLWADRITVRRGLGCSPYFAVCGAHPVLPLDLEEATWLVEWPDTIISTDELVGLRAIALAKHTYHVNEMRDRVAEFKKTEAAKYAEKYKHVIKDYVFEPGDIVMIRNTSVEDSMNRRNKERWKGPLVVVRRTKGGSYIVCEMNGAVLQRKIGRFRVVPFAQRHKIALPKKIEKLIDLSKKKLDELENDDSDDEGEYTGKDYQFGRIRLNPPGAVRGEDSDDEESDVEEMLEEEGFRHWDNEPESNLGPRRSKRRQGVE